VTTINLLQKQTRSDQKSQTSTEISAAIWSTQQNVSLRPHLLAVNSSSWSRIHKNQDCHQNPITSFLGHAKPFL